MRETIEERRGAEPLLKVGTCRNHAKLVTNNNLKSPKIRLEIQKTRPNIAAKSKVQAS